MLSVVLYESFRLKQGMSKMGAAQEATRILGQLLCYVDAVLFTIICCIFRVC